MAIYKNIAVGVFVLALLGCAARPEPQEPTHYIFPELPDRIALQNLKTRVVVYCSANYHKSTEACARHYEEQGYVRLTEIPSQPADKDFLQTGTYPTRRWRNNELVPRW